MKKKIILVPCTHWDREWYFTTQTSNLLLHRLFDDFSKYKLDFKFTLDGQASLVDNYTEISPLSNEVKQSIQNNHLRIGPLYAQSDVLNSMFGTTQYNILMGKEATKKYNAKLAKTIFMPDTFGFNEQLPQIFKLNGYKNFVCWRGIKSTDINKSNAALWEGIDGTRIPMSVMASGYGPVLEIFPWDTNKKKLELQFEETIARIYKQISLQESYSEQDVYWIPLSGDQLPYPKKIHKLIEKLNKENKYIFEIGHHDDYFDAMKDKFKKAPVIDYFMYYSGTSKIHRTIHSNRYDIKRAYREIEFNLFYKMEQVEIMYSQLGGKLLNKLYKDKYIYQPLLESSAHDSLGGCNSDISNSIILSRLQSINVQILSYIDLMIRDIKEMLKVNDNQLIVFNFAPFKQDIFIEDIISNRSKDDISTLQNDVTVTEYHKEDLSFKIHDPVFNHYVKVLAKDMKPFSYKIIDLESKNKIVKPLIKVDIDKDKVVINLKQKMEFQILIDENLGDEFDFSTNEKALKKLISDITIINSFTNYDTTCYLLNAKTMFKNKSVDLKINLFISSDKVDISIKYNNILENARISLVFPNKLNSLSRHLAFINQQVDKIDNWKDLKFKDKPVPNYPQDGLVSLDNQLNIFTKGTNEVEIHDEYTQIVMARFSEMIGKTELDYRPGVASGLTYKVFTPEAQLKKELCFDFRLTFGNPIKDLNEWYFNGYITTGKPTNVIIKKTDKFIINFSELKEKKIDFVEIDHHKNLIGLYNFDNNKKIRYIVSNPLNKNHGDFKPYEIKFNGNWNK